MERLRIGIVRVITTETAGLLEAHAVMLRRVFPCIDTVSACIPDQPEGVFDKATETSATPKVVSVAAELARKGAAAVIVSCCADPGVEDARALVDIPVIGAGSAVSAVALACAARIGVLGIGFGAPTVMRDILGRRMVGYAVPVGVRTTRDLFGEDCLRECIKSARSLVDMGAEAICLGCTGMSTTGVAVRLREELKIPVIDPLMAAGGVALTAILQERVK